MKPVSPITSLPHEAIQSSAIPKKNTVVDTTIQSNDDRVVDKIDPYSKSDEMLATPTNAAANNKNKPPSDKSTATVIKYKVAVDKAYFFNSAQDSTKRKAYMVPTDNASLLPEKEENGFIYVVFTNQFGQTSKGWLKKSDLKLVSE